MLLASFFHRTIFFDQDLLNQTSYAGRLLGPYYERLEDYQDPIFDDEGVLLIDFSKRKERGITGIHYFPISITQFALRNYDLFLETRNKIHFVRFLNQCTWLVRNQGKNDRVEGVWLSHFDVGSAIRAPWVSAMAQGQGISALLRAFIETDDKVYLKAATKALSPFNVSIQDGGVKWADEDGNIFYEEYPMIPPNHILNGFIYSLFGLYDYFRVTGAKHSLNLFQNGIQTLMRTISSYDSGFWSKYSLSNKSNISNHFNLASPVYHNIHINQLRILYLMTGETVFREYANRWLKYQKSLFAFPIGAIYLFFLAGVKLRKALL